MGLEALLLKLENREPATPETPCNLAGVAANPALSLACTLETPATPQIDNGGSDAWKATTTASRWWLLHYSDREPVEVASFPDATHAAILERHLEAIAAVPIAYSFKPRLIDRTTDEREAFEERAAIMEYDGGLSRKEAERLASNTEGVK